MRLDQRPMSDPSPWATERADDIAGEYRSALASSDFADLKLDIAFALDAAKAEGKAAGLDLAVTAAKGGASDYLGGYRDEAGLAAFRHGMDTIVNVLEALAKQDPTDFQTRACVALGTALARGEHHKEPR